MPAHFIDMEKTMKKLMLASVMIASTALTGCAKIKDVNLTAATSVNASDVALYEAAQQCVLDNVNPPSRGQLFTFQSDKTNSFAFVVQSMTGSLGGIDTMVTYRYNKGVFKAKQPMLFDGEGAKLTNSDFYGVVINDANDYTVSVLKELASCTDEYAANSQ